MGKTADLDRFTGEVIKNVNDWVFNCFWRLCKRAFESMTVPEVWKNGVIIRCIKEKKWVQQQQKCIRLRSVVKKVYGEILIDCVKRITDGIIGEERSNFKTSWDCVNQVFVLRQQITKKVRGRGRKAHIAFGENLWPRW